MPANLTTLPAETDKDGKVTSRPVTHPIREMRDTARQRINISQDMVATLVAIGTKTVAVGVPPLVRVRPRVRTALLALPPSPRGRVRE
jgi:hypothetical protein